MAKTSAPSTTGSQFFIIYKDSSAGLSKDYSVVGKVTKGLDIVKAVAAGGLAKDQTAPKLAIKITSMTIAG
jgi:peptidyl-prolyl cis-trans isomerase B (cyclophilin B)